jgi:hypothetical protein
MDGALLMDTDTATRLPYPIRLGDKQRREWQAAADASGRTLAGWIKWTCDSEIVRLTNYRSSVER